MHLIELVIQKNQLSGRRHITPLGWIVAGIVALFIGALAMGWFRLMTRNVNTLDLNPMVTMAQFAEASAPTVASAVNANDDAPDWTVKIVKTPLGANVVEAPPEVTHAVLRDFDKALNEWDAHKFEHDYLKAHASEYFIGKQLARMQGMLNWMQQERRVVALREYKLLPLGRSVQYAPNGTQIILVEYIAAGKTYEYDLKTRARVDEQMLPDRVVMTEMSYDADAKRWKISRFALALDLNTKQVLWQDE